jgi:hypothetical protein
MHGARLPSHEEPSSDSARQGAVRQPLHVADKVNGGLPQ